MDKGTCIWSDGCDRLVYGRGLCKTHRQRARRNGTLATYLGNRLCGNCGAQLPSTARSTRQFCNKHCRNAAAYAADPEGRKAAHRAWLEATWERRRVERLALKPVRYCEICGNRLPIAVNSRRRFCSRKCINARSIELKSDERLEANRRLRARRLGTPGNGVSVADWRALIERFGKCCAYCDRRRPLTMDHVVPLVRGGQHALGNVLPACLPCNSSKRDKLLIEWRLPGRVIR